MRIRCLLLFVCWCAVTPRLGVAQAVHGRVFDAGTRQPLGAVGVRMEQGNRLIGTTLSDSLGNFVLRAPAHGRYRLIASRIGYADARSEEVDLSGGQSITVELMLSIAAVPIAQLTVVAQRDPYLESAGFYDRMRTGNGFYMTEREIKRGAAVNIIDVLRSARGVKVQRVNMRQEVYFSTPSCLPQIVLDGVTVRWGGAIATSRTGSAVAAQPLEDLVKVGHVEAIEVYRAFNGVPPQYVGPNAHCGTILIWTRHK